MALWRDPLDELIEDLEAALPAAEVPSRYQHLPRLEDLQAVISPILFATKEQLDRILADPEYQRLSDTVMQQLACIRDRSSEQAAPDAHPHRGQSAPSPVNSQTPVSADRPPAGLRICLCGADADAEHTSDCPFTAETG